MALFVRRLTHLDVSLWCPDRGLIGASWLVDVELDGELGEDGMLFDFGEVKPWIKARLDGGADHTLLVPTEAPGVSVSECREGICVRTTTPYAMEVRGPRQAFTLLPWRRITPEAMAEHLSRQLMRQPPERVSSIELSLADESIDGAAYTYSHGLRRHAGNCQRIAHGHRSRLEIVQRGVRQPELERRYARWLDDTYLVDEHDLEQHQGDMLQCGYRSPQGLFHLRLPRERCHVLPGATTVERIAQWLAATVARDTGEDTAVRAYEGVDKGATARSPGERSR
ncbi:6-carboxytetrahydropterin synthase [Halomonas sp. H33-56]|uniref:6-carboxy-5,6,7,8-tetrahydropterin synthase n=2 Tax=unclassified Halomonas TaxID=2609666 RepID=A0AAU7KMC2_9GAMM|nr:MULTISPECIES: 6-carboxytetrahydropterin synthase [unclassified Halomonas]MBR9773264.1 6-pyruvoyl tetrahydropterin synthase-related protein [Gammaproteobacteria bacterium]MBY6112019.1 6-carboxytetrahydropterin synthase [Halomonas sp. DP1Y21-3]RQW69859.1 6-pyruvoyl tetrahydropterin synthase-related protein [Halomonas sp. YLB-10]